MNISVVLPNYNHAHNISETLEALFSQSAPPNEVIIIDDASTDDSLSVIAKWQKKYSTISLLQNATNQGPIPSINHGIEAATSEYLAFCSADDIVLPGFFEKAKAYLDTHPEVGLCSGKTCHFKDQTPYQFIPDRMPLGNAPQAFTPDQLPRIFKKTTFFIHSNCTLYRRKHVLELGGLNPKLKSYGDWHMNCQIALKYGVGYIPALFGAFRLSEKSYAQKLKGSQDQETMFHTLLEEIEKSGMQQIYKKTGLLAQGGIRLVLFLAKTRRYRSYFPRAFIKKCHFHLNKLLKNIL